MHVTDWFTTLLRAAGVTPPTDRMIDGLDQLDWLTGRREDSAREGFSYWMGPDMYGVRWHDFKLVLVVKKYMTEAGQRTGRPARHQPDHRPPRTRARRAPYLHTWTASHFNRIIAQFQASLQQEPLTPAAAPLDHVPNGT